MQIERIGTQAVAPTGKSQPATANTAPSQANAATPQAQPLSGGVRTVSLGLLNEAETEVPAIPTDFAELVAQKNRELATSLTSAFKSAQISMDSPIKLTIASDGTITTSDSRKEKVEKLFKDNPELAKQFKETAALNKLQALNTAMRQFNEARRNARTDAESDQAQQDYIGDSMAIGTLGNSLVLSDGKVESPAVVYMDKRIANNMAAG
jgi:hypothetical protein